MQIDRGRNSITNLTIVGRVATAAARGGDTLAPVQLVRCDNLPGSARYYLGGPARPAKF